MTDPSCLPFAFPSVRGKKLTAAFDGGRLTLEGGVMLLAQAAQRLGIAEILILHEVGQAVEALAHVGVTGRQPDPGYAYGEGRGCR